MTKENIIIAALRLFLTHGYKSVSLMDVAAEAGITKGGIYHYFSSKDNLLHLSFHFVLDRFEANYAALLNDKHSIKDVLYALMVDRDLDRYYKDLLNVEGECRIDYVHFAIEVMRMFPDIQERIEQGYIIRCETLGHKIQEAVESGELRSNLDSQGLAANVLAIVNGQNSLGSHFQSTAKRQQMFLSFWSTISNI